MIKIVKYKVIIMNYLTIIFSHVFMNHFIERLPLDIVVKIIPYTYEIQDKDVLNDIVNYSETKHTLFNLYHRYWIIEMQEEVPQDKNWLSNDLIARANNYKATMYGLDDTFYNIFKRNLFLKTKAQIDKYFNTLGKKKVDAEINVYLGLFTPNERNETIHHFLRNH